MRGQWVTKIQKNVIQKKYFVVVVFFLGVAVAAVLVLVVFELVLVVLVTGSSWLVVEFVVDFAAVYSQLQHAVNS